MILALIEIQMSRMEYILKAVLIKSWRSFWVMVAMTSLVTGAECCAQTRTSPGAAEAPHSAGNQARATSTAQASSRKPVGIKAPLALQYQQRFAYYAKLIDRMKSEGKLSDEESATLQIKLERIKVADAYASRYHYQRRKTKYLNQKIIKFDALLRASLSKSKQQ